MGELRTRKRGKSWEYSFEGARIKGKRKSISKAGFRTKVEALAAGIKAKAEYDQAGIIFKASEMSLSDYLDFWLDGNVKTNMTHTMLMHLLLSYILNQHWGTISFLHFLLLPSSNGLIR